MLQEIGDDQEQAASTLGANGWQTFWQVTLPSIRWGVTYGVVLATARALGEFGAVAVVSGKISGQTETLPLLVENEYDNFNVAGAYAAAILLAVLAVLDPGLDEPAAPPLIRGEDEELGLQVDRPTREGGLIMADSRSRLRRSRPESERRHRSHQRDQAFGDFVALDDVSIDVPDGGLTALLGPSGSGKSTLLRVIAGLEQPDSGRVLISGEDTTRTRVQDRNVGFVFQHYAAFKHMTVFDNIAFGLKIRGEGSGKIRERVKQLIELVHLTGFEKRYPNQLSGGQRQRMALARALAVEPKVLLLDEPFGALDAKVRQELRTWLRRLHDDVHVTTIFVTHDQEEAMEVAEQIIVMNDGKVEQSGGPRDLYEHPASEFVMGFVGPANRLGDAWVRPHDVEIRHEPNGRTIEALIDRIVHLGFEVRVELTLQDGDQFSVQLTREQVDELELKEGAIVFRAAEDRAGLRRRPEAAQLARC